MSLKLWITASSTALMMLLIGLIGLFGLLVALNGFDGATGGAILGSYLVVALGIGGGIVWASLQCIRIGSARTNWPPWLLVLVTIISTTITGSALLVLASILLIIVLG